VRRLVVPKTTLSRPIRYEPVADSDKSNIIVKWECLNRAGPRVEYSAPVVTSVNRVCSLCGCPYNPLCNANHPGAATIVVSPTTPTTVANFNSGGPCVPGMQPNVETIYDDVLNRDHRVESSVRPDQLPEEVRRIPAPLGYDYLDDLVRGGPTSGRIVPRLDGSPQALDALSRIPREKLREVGLQDYIDQIDQLGRGGRGYYNGY